jgi:hypothetical protein
VDVVTLVASLAGISWDDGGGFVDFRQAGNDDYLFDTYNSCIITTRIVIVNSCIIIYNSL